MSFASANRRMHRTAIPLAGIIDILFLLLIFFATTSSFRASEQTIEVDVPATEAGQTLEPVRTEILINITDGGEILVGGQEYSIERLQAMIRELVAEFPHERVIIRGDRDSNYGRVIAVWDAARAAGARNIQFSTVRRADQVAG
jgi:biopolymer transport protein ExbD